MPIHLKAVSQSWLHNACAAFNLQQESLNIGVHLFVYIANMHGHDCAQQDAAKTWQWFYGKHQMPNG
jgi:hypothetical protein